MYFNYYYIVNNYYPDYIDENILNENTITSIQQLSVEEPADEIPSTILPALETGILSLKVLTESGQPIEDALITVFHFHLNGDLEVHYSIKTDKNGSVPEIELPVRFNEILENTEYYYSTYTLRVTADNYVPVNIVNFQVFPKIKTNYVVRMVPLTGAVTEEEPEKTIVIPNRELEQNNIFNSY